MTLWPVRQWMTDYPGQLTRFVINGIVATSTHYLLLVALLELARLPSAALANLVAATAGTGVSFFGNRQFVFRQRGSSVLWDASKFVSVYGVLALYNTAYMFLWADKLALNYHLGFVFCVAIQTCLSFLANRFIVFRHRPQGHTER